MKKKPKKLRYSDIDLSLWREYGDIWTDSLWTIESRDRTGGHELDYHGNYVPQIATQVFRRYTRENEIVLDLFLGSGTSAIEAARLNRRMVGVELKPDLVDKVLAKLPAEMAGSRAHILCGDSTSLETVTEVRKALQSMGIAAFTSAKMGIIT